MHDSLEKKENNLLIRCSNGNQNFERKVPCGIWVMFRQPTTVVRLVLWFWSIFETCYSLILILSKSTSKIFELIQFTGSACYADDGHGESVLY